MSEEIWKPIPELEGYEASSFGNVRSKRKVLHRRPFLARGDKLYCKTDCWAKNKGLFVHRLVALAFLGKPPEGQNTVDHLDGDGTNNRPENLEWVSLTENLRRKWGHGKEEAA